MLFGNRPVLKLADASTGFDRFEEFHTLPEKR
jgi:hypothetical protein